MKSQSFYFVQAITLHLVSASLDYFTRIESDLFTADVIEVKHDATGVIRCAIWCKQRSSGFLCPGFQYIKSNSTCILLEHVRTYTIPFIPTTKPTGIVTYVPKLTCPDGWSLLLCKCYHHTDEYNLMVNTAAHEYCQQHDSYVAVLATEIEFLTVMEHFNQETYTIKGTWLGAEHNNNTGTSFWLNGEPWTYENFGRSATFTGPCLGIRTSRTGPDRRWASFDCMSNLHVLCEKDPK